MKVFFAGPLTDLKNPEETKAFYKKLAQVARKNGAPFFWAFMNGTDPILNPDVAPKDVYQRDIRQLDESDVMVAYVGEPSLGTGIEIEHAFLRHIPVYILYEKGRRISRMLRGCPAVKGEINFTNETEALAKFNKLLQGLKK